MLKAMREGTKSGLLKYFLLTMMAVGVLSLVFLDMSGSFSGGIGTSSVAKIGNTEIGSQQFLNRFQQAEQQASQQFGFGEMPQSFREQLAREVVEQQVREQVFLVESNNIGLLISDKIAAKEIKKQLEPLTQSGFTEEEALQRNLHSLGMSEAGYISLAKQSIATRQLVSAVSLASYAPNSMLSDVYRLQNQKRSGVYLELKLSDFEQRTKAPSAEEIEAYYNANLSRYLTPEYRTLSYSIFDKSIVGDLSPISDDELEAVYEDRLDDYVIAAGRVTDQAVFQSAETAQKVVETAYDNHDLTSALVGIPSGDYAFVEGEVVSEDDLIIEVVDAAFDTPLGEITGPIQTPLGWIVMKVISEKEETTQPFDTVKQDLRKTYEQELLEEKLYSIVNDIDASIAKGVILADVANEYSLDVIELPPITREGAEANGKTLPDTSQDMFKEMLGEAFTLEEDEPTALMETDNGFVIFEVGERIAPAPRPLEDVLTQVIADVRKTNAQSAMSERAEALKAEMESGAAPSGAKAIIGLQQTELTAQSKHPVMAANSLFTLSNKGDVSVLSGADSLFVIRLDSIDLSKAPEGESDLDGAKAFVGEQVRMDILSQFENALRDKHDVKINDHAISKLVAPADGF